MKAGTYDVCAHKKREYGKNNFHPQNANHRLIRGRIVFREHRW